MGSRKVLAGRMFVRVVWKKRILKRLIIRIVGNKTDFGRFHNLVIMVGADHGEMSMMSRMGVMSDSSDHQR